MNKIFIQIIDVVVLILYLLAALLIGITRGYEITGDRSLDANCLAYSKEVRDELLAQGEDAHLIGFLSGDIRPGHCTVVVNPGTTDYIVIESYTGREFKGEPFEYELDYYLYNLLGGFPTKAWIFN